VKRIINLNIPIPRQWISVCHRSNHKPDNLVELTGLDEVFRNRVVTHDRTNYFRVASEAKIATGHSTYWLEIFSWWWSFHDEICYSYDI